MSATDVASELADRLACPRCKGSIAILEDDVSCSSCGSIGRVWNGIVDFLSPETQLMVANNGRFDLAHDQQVAERLVEIGATASLAELRELGAELLDPPVPQGFMARRAHQRYERFYHCVECEVGMRAGVGDLAKVNGARTYAGLAKLEGDWALEAGGSFGLHLPGFRGAFKNVVMLDCSLSFLVLARKLCDDLGLTNMYFVRGNLEALPFRTGALDFIHENGVIEHVLRPQQMVDEALRCRSERGTFMCLSPNLFPLTLEPHFRLPLFGLWPRWLRRILLPAVRGVNSEAGTDLRSLGQLRCYLEAVEKMDLTIFFLPPQLEETVRTTFARRTIMRWLSTPRRRRVLLFAVNRCFLPIAPYHVALVSRRIGET